MLSVDQHPAGYSTGMSAVHGARWTAGPGGGGTYVRVAADARSRSPPYSVGRGPVSGGPLPSPSGDGSAAASSFGVGRVPTSSVYHVDTGRSYTPLHVNLALAVDTDNSAC